MLNSVSKKTSPFKNELNQLQGTWLCQYKAESDICFFGTQWILFQAFVNNDYQVKGNIQNNKTFEKLALDHHEKIGALVKQALIQFELSVTAQPYFRAITYLNFLIVKSEAFNKNNFGVSPALPLFASNTDIKTKELLTQNVISYLDPQRNLISLNEAKNLQKRLIEMYLACYQSELDKNLLIHNTTLISQHFPSFNLSQSQTFDCTSDAGLFYKLLDQIPSFLTGNMIRLYDKLDLHLNKTTNNLLEFRVEQPSSSLYHYIGILFIVHQNRPHFMIVDTQLGTLAFDNILTFKKGFEIIIRHYLAAFKKPMVAISACNVKQVLQNNININFPPLILPNIDEWQSNLFSATSQPNFLPKTSVNQPKWFKEIATLLSNYHIHTDEWLKFKALLKLQEIFIRCEKEIEGDLKLFKFQKPEEIEQLKKNIDVYLNSYHELRPSVKQPC